MMMIQARRFKALYLVLMISFCTTNTNEIKVDSSTSTTSTLVEDKDSDEMNSTTTTTTTIANQAVNTNFSKEKLSDLALGDCFNTDEKDLIINKIKKAKTDPLPMPSSLNELEKRPEAKNLIGIYSSLTGLTLENSINEFSGKNFSDFKENLSQVLVDKLQPVSAEIKKLLSEESFLDKILLDGAEKADKIATNKIKKIHEIMGF